MTLLDLAQSPARYDGWAVYITKLHGLGPELFDCTRRTFLVDPTNSSPKRAVAHALAHLFLRHHLEGHDLTDEQCEAADTHVERLSEVRVALADVEAEACPAEGETGDWSILAA